MKRLHVNSLMLLARPRLISIVALTLFGIVGHVHGQWTTTGNDISNSNTGNVGVGTTTPLFKFMFGAIGMRGAQRTFSLLLTPMTTNRD